MDSNAKSELTHPSFDSFSFAYKSSIFSVFVEMVDDSGTSLTENRKQLLLNACQSYNMVPCLFKIRVKETKPLLHRLFKTSVGDESAFLEPFEKGWNLYNARTNDKIFPHLVAEDFEVKMSDWELSNFAIQIVRNDLEKQGNTILSFCDLPEINPQVWFRDRRGNICWAIVKYVINEEDLDYRQWTGLEERTPQLLSYDGFFASVGFFSDNTHSKETLNRGDRMFVKYKGLERIYVS
jgi:hypothetical protein